MIFCIKLTVDNYNKYNFFAYHNSDTLKLISVDCRLHDRFGSIRWEGWRLWRHIWWGGSPE